jgi:uncharacterized membrane protein YoaK (UPF0700 family)
MNAVGRDVVRDLFLLGVTAGSADAAGYLGLGNVFTSNMTGNVVLLGIHLGQGHLEAAARSVYALGLFVAGVALGTWLGRDIPATKWPRIVSRLLRLEKALLILFALGWACIANHDDVRIAYPLLSALALAMGIQSAAMSRVSAPGAQTTAVTGTLTALIGSVAGLFTAADIATKKNNRGRIRFQAGLIALYCVGAAASGALMLYEPRWAGCPPAIAVLFVGWQLTSRPAPASRAQP